MENAPSPSCVCDLYSAGIPKHSQAYQIKEYCQNLLWAFE